MLCLTSLNSEFSFSYTGCHTKAEEPSQLLRKNNWIHIFPKQSPTILTITPRMPYKKYTHVVRIDVWRICVWIILCTFSTSNWFCIFLTKELNKKYLNKRRSFLFFCPCLLDIREISLLFFTVCEYMTFSCTAWPRDWTHYDQATGYTLIPTYIHRPTSWYILEPLQLVDVLYYMVCRLSNESWYGFFCISNFVGYLMPKLSL